MSGNSWQDSHGCHHVGLFPLHRHFSNYNTWTDYVYSAVLLIHYTRVKECIVRILLCHHSPETRSLEVFLLRYGELGFLNTANSPVWAFLYSVLLNFDIGPSCCQGNTLNHIEQSWIFNCFENKTRLCGLSTFFSSERNLMGGQKTVHSRELFLFTMYLCTYP